MASNRKNNYNLEWAKALDQIIADEVAEKKPKGNGWHDFFALKNMLDFGQVKLRRYLKAGVESGKILVFKGMALGTDGIARQKVWYKLKDR